MSKNIKPWSGLQNGPFFCIFSWKQSPDYGCFPISLKKSLGHIRHRLDNHTVYTIQCSLNKLSWDRAFEKHIHSIIFTIYVGAFIKYRVWGMVHKKYFPLPFAMSQFFALPPPPQVLMKIVYFFYVTSHALSLRLIFLPTPSLLHI